jgi:hypothetical protein
MKLRRYAVTVMDNWTPMRTFWTLDGAFRWYNEFISGAHLHFWYGGRWREIQFRAEHALEQSAPQKQEG